MGGDRARLIRTASVAVAIAAVAFVPRAASLDRAFTIDERLWIDRSDRFTDAVFDARFGDAVETGHPGVTTMWVAGLAQRTLPDGADLRSRYARARVWMAAVSAMLIALLWLLFRGLAGDLASGIAAGFLVLDPFLLAHNRVVHLDGLLALFVVASFLALLRGMRERADALIVCSGVLAGLAGLTKQAGLFIVPATLVALWRDGGGIRTRFLRWLLAAGATAFVLWPALWVRPWHAIGLMLGGGGAALAETDAAGFFLGRRPADPGPLFYPVALLWRTSLVTLPAGVAAVAWALKRRRKDRDAATAVWLAVFGAGFLLAMTLIPKKSDRYVLPVFILIDLIVAIAAAKLLQRWVVRVWSRAKARRRVALAGALTAALALHGGPALALSPYQLAHFNWLVGGPVTAQRIMVVGWGQGLDEAATQMSELPDVGRLTVATTYRTNFREFFRGRTVLIPEASQADFVLFYISSIQVGSFEREWRRYRDRRPVWVVEVNRMPYVRVYARPQ